MYRVALRHPYIVGSLAAAGTTAVVAVSRAEAQFAQSMAWPVSSSSNNSYSSGGVLIPSVQATIRSLRLIQTAVLMAADYKLDEWGWTTATTSAFGNDDDQARAYWEEQVEQRRQALLAWP